MSCWRFECASLWSVAALAVGRCHSIDLECLLHFGSGNHWSTDFDSEVVLQHHRRQRSNSGWVDWLHLHASLELIPGFVEFEAEKQIGGLFEGIKAFIQLNFPSEAKQLSYGWLVKFLCGAVWAAFKSSFEPFFILYLKLGHSRCFWNFLLLDSKTSWRWVFDPQLQEFYRASQKSDFPSASENPWEEQFSHSDNFTKLVL